MSKASEDSIEWIRSGVDHMCDGTRVGFVCYGLANIVSLVPEQQALVEKYYALWAQTFLEPKSWIDQTAMHLGAEACLELSIREADSSPLGEYVARFNQNKRYGNVPRSLAKIVISAELQNALIARNTERAEAIYEIGDSAKLLLPSDRLFVAAGNVGRALATKFRFAR